MRFFSLLALGVVACSAAPLARAIDFTVGGTDYNVQYITNGSAGPYTSKAMLVLDFNAAIYSFGYQWNGTPRSSAQLLDDIAAAGGVDVTSSNPGTPVEYTTGISYSGVGQLYAGSQQYGDYPGNWYEYYVSRTPATWDFAQVGEGLNPVVDGDWNLWAWQTDAAGSNVPGPIPEPASLLLLGIGALALLKRRSEFKL